MKKRNGLAPFATRTFSASIAMPRESASDRGGRLAQDRQPGRLAVVRLAGTDGGDSRLGHVRRRLEVGLADLEMDHVAARRLEGARPGEHGEGALGAEPRRRLGAMDGLIAGTPIGSTLHRA